LESHCILPKKHTKGVGHKTKRNGRKAIGGRVSCKRTSGTLAFKRGDHFAVLEGKKKKKSDKAHNATMQRKLGKKHLRGKMSTGGEQSR